MAPPFQVMPLFPVPLYVGPITDGIFAQEIAFAEQLEYEINTGGNLSSTDHHVLNHPEMARLRKIVDAHIENYRTQILATENELYITQSWTNRNLRDAAHHVHYHSNSIVSGVIYFSHGQAVPPINFKSDRRLQIQLQHKQFNAFNTDAFTFAPASQVVILFPSWLDHHVPTNQTDDTRVSLAFNTFVRGTLGSDKQLTHLPL